MSVSSGELLLTHTSLEFTREDKKVVKEEPGKVYKLLDFFFGRRKFVNSFVAQKSYMVGPIAHRLGERALLDEVVYRAFKPELAYLAVGKVKEFFKVNFESTLKDRPTRHGDTFNSSVPETNLSFFKHISNLFRNILLVVNGRRLGEDVGYRNRIASLLLDILLKPFSSFISHNSRKANNRLVAFRTLGKDGVGNGLESLGVCGMSPREDVVAVEGNVPETMRALAIKNKHWR